MHFRKILGPREAEDTTRLGLAVLPRRVTLSWGQWCFTVWSRAHCLGDWPPRVRMYESSGAVLCWACSESAGKKPSFAQVWNNSGQVRRCESRRRSFVAILSSNKHAFRIVAGFLFTVCCSLLSRSFADSSPEKSDCSCATICFCDTSPLLSAQPPRTSSMFAVSSEYTERKTPFQKWVDTHNDGSVTQNSYGLYQ